MGAADIALKEIIDEKIGFELPEPTPLADVPKKRKKQHHH